MSYNRVESKRRANTMKPFAKCLQLSNLTRMLFPSCTSSHQSAALNYEYFHYEPSDCSSRSQFTPPNDNRPATSTMIESSNESGFVYNQTADSYTFQATSPAGLKSMSGPNYVTLVSAEQASSDENYFYELEETCKSNLLNSEESVSSVGNDFEVITMRHHNSPISTFYEHDSLSNTSADAYLLHSTEMLVHEEREAKLSMNFSTTSSIMASPVSTSTSFHSQLGAVDVYDSLLEMLSSTVASDAQTTQPTHVCAQNYDATFVGDVTVHFADTIQIVRDSDSDEWLYVRVASDGREGYVPRTIVIDLKQFVDQLVKTKSSLVNNLFN
jgi:hypothetical protein